MDAVTQVPVPANEPVLDYAPGSPERAVAGGRAGRARQHPHRPAPHHRWQAGDGHAARRSTCASRTPGARSWARCATPPSATPQAAVDAAKAAAPGWRALSFDDRAAILLKAAELLSGPWRARLNAATMLGQSKTAYQAEIDAACELIDFWRINVHFARQILAEQPPLNAKGIWNRTDHRPLEGFVYAITPVQLHRDRRQPADRAGADGQHRRVEAVPDPAVRRPGDHGAARGGGPAAGRHQPGDR